MSIATLMASFITFYTSYQEDSVKSSPTIYYSFEYLFGAAIMSWHAKLIRDFNSEPQ